MDNIKLIRTLFLIITLSIITIVIVKSNPTNQAVAQRKAPIIFAAVGDYGEDDDDHSNVAAMIQGWNPDFIVTQGDNRYDDSTFDEVIGQRYCNYLTDVNGGASCPSGNSLTNAFFPAIGNHDYDDGGGINEYLDYFNLPGTGITTTNSSGNERYYDFIIGPVHFFVLNSDSQEPDGIDSTSTQAQWLQTQVAASTSNWQVVSMHHAPYSSSSNHGSDPTLQWPFTLWGVDAVLAGHDHIFERIFQDDIVYYVNGLGGRSIYGIGSPISGSQIRYNDDFGAMRITADSASMIFEFFSIDDGANGGNGGTLIDSYTINAPIPPTETPIPPTETPIPPTPTPEMFYNFSPLILSDPNN